MNRMMQFDSPFLLGFEQTQTLIERAARGAQEAYPPYNVEETGEGSLRITMAVAGFSLEDLDVVLEARQLTVSGKRGGEDVEKEYLHRGIAARAFSRTFVLADGMRVDAALLEHGLLHVDVSRPEIKAKAERIPIRAAG